MSIDATRSLGRKVLLISASHRIASLVLLVFVLPSIRLGHPFDSSSLLLSASPPHSLGLNIILEPLIRWDAVHFLDIAQRGYTLEQHFAFQPGLPAWLRLTGLDADQGWSASQAVLLTSLSAALASTLSPWLLYQVTRRHTASNEFAFLSALFSVFSPAPATLITPSPEAFFSFFTLLGLLALSPRSTSASTAEKASSADFRLRVTLAAFTFALATAFRANGVLLSGFVAWHLWWANQSKATPLLLRAVMTVFVAIPALPFLGFQAWAYDLFCSADSGQARAWCASHIPSIYSFVQREYWNVGFLRYWTVQQAPNFVLAAPVLTFSVYGLILYSRNAHSQISASVLQSPFKVAPKSGRQSDKTGSTTQAVRPEAAGESDQAAKATAMQAEASSARTNDLHYTTSPTLLPHFLHNLATTCLLVFVSHVQISLRFATPGGMPFVWWAAAAWVLGDHSDADGAAALSRRAASRRRRLGILVSALVMWNALSLALYSGFYPPA
ncbi:hypothetical protein V8E36_001609 [Tilletia maclaganii]